MGPIQVTEAVKDAPLVALYFSAHWCGPCRSFTPKLVIFVEMLEEEGIRLPVIFGSSDRDAAAFDEYFASMPWYAFPHGSARIDALKAIMKSLPSHGSSCSMPRATSSSTRRIRWCL